MSANRPTDLPDFKSPPVTEVVLGIQFDAVTGFTSSHMGLIWQGLRDQFPRTEDKPPLEPNREEFGSLHAREPGLRLEIGQKPPIPRCWFLNESGTELVQVQHDRILHNWRKVGAETEYPRYEPIKATFEADVRQLEETLIQNGLSRLRPNQWEITYVNHIYLPLHDGAKDFGQLEGVIAPWSGCYSNKDLGKPEDVQLSVRYPIYDAAQQPIGRLHVTTQPGVLRNDNSQVLILTLTARGRPADTSVAASMDGLDIGREHIVRGFTSFTSRKAHEIWKRIDAARTA